MRKTPNTACKEAPRAIVAATVNALKDTMSIPEFNAMRAFAENEPRKTPGHDRYPKNKTPTRAIPEAGHTADAKPGGIARRSPSFATIKYAAARPMI